MPAKTVLQTGPAGYAALGWVPWRQLAKWIAQVVSVGKVKFDPTFGGRLTLDALGQKDCVSGALKGQTANSIVREPS